MDSRTCIIDMNTDKKGEMFMSGRKVKRISFKKFTEQYATEDVCRQTLVCHRRPDGFVCPVCGN